MHLVLLQSRVIHTSFRFHVLGVTSEDVDTPEQPRRACRWLRSLLAENLRTVVVPVSSSSLREVMVMEVKSGRTSAGWRRHCR